VILQRFHGFDQIVQTKGIILQEVRVPITTTFLYVVTVVHLIQSLQVCLISPIIIYNHFKQKIQLSQNSLTGTVQCITLSLISCGFIYLYFYISFK
jgi:cytochrome c oxidase subunit 3